jgi:hypothetical protein
VSALAWTVKLDNIVVGPGTVVQGAVVGTEVSLTASVSDFTNNTSLTIDSAASFIKYRRVGDMIHVRARYVFTAVGTNGSALRWNYSVLGSGITLDTSKTPEFPAAGRLGIGNPEKVIIKFIDTTYAEFGSNGSNASARGDEFGSSAGLVKFLEFQFALPVTQWVGSGTVNLGANDVEYAWSNTADTSANLDDTTSVTGYGPKGVGFIAFNSSTTAARSRVRVVFQTPIQATDIIELQFSLDGGVTWVTNWEAVSSQAWQNGSLYGAYIYEYVNSTTIRVGFGNHGRLTGNTYASAGPAWADIAGSTYRWRVMKAKAGAATGFGLHQPGVAMRSQVPWASIFLSRVQAG